MTGSYVLLINVERACEIEVGALGELTFEAGAYAYVGSAMSGLDARIARHLREDKPLHWHIDYLLRHAEIADVIRVESDERLECRIAEALHGRLEAVEDFGCSDCNCASHLFYHRDMTALRSAVLDAVGYV